MGTRHGWAYGGLLLLDLSSSLKPHGGLSQVKASLPTSANLSQLQARTLQVVSVHSTIFANSTAERREITNGTLVKIFIS